MILAAVIALLGMGYVFMGREKTMADRLRSGGGTADTAAGADGARGGLCAAGRDSRQLVSGRRGPQRAGREPVRGAGRTAVLDAAEAARAGAGLADRRGDLRQGQVCPRGTGRGGGFVAVVADGGGAGDGGARAGQRVFAAHDDFAGRGRRC